MAIWKLHLRPKDVPARDVVDYCLANDFVGLGWKGPAEQADEAISDYLARHRAHWRRREPAVHAILEQVRVGDLIWSRDADGRYLLAKVTGKPFPRFGEWADVKDMYHVAPVQFADSGEEPINDDEVPGRVKAAFSQRGRTINRLKDERVADYSEWLFAHKRGRDAPRPAKRLEFIASLSSFELEDLVALYLQECGWRVLLSSHSPTTPRFEATFIRNDGQTAGVQVKQGTTELDVANYGEGERVNHVFLFAASGHYGTVERTNVTKIGAEDLIAFARDHRDALSASMRRWFDWSQEAAQGAELDETPRNDEP